MELIDGYAEYREKQDAENEKKWFETIYLKVEKNLKENYLNKKK